MNAQMTEPTRHGVIAWMARNPVAANLMMMLLIVGGLIFSTSVKQEVMPEFDLDMINVSVAYPGASPEEIEEGIVLAIEEEISGLDGIKKINSVAAEASPASPSSSSSAPTPTAPSTTSRARSTASRHSPRTPSGR